MYLVVMRVNDDVDDDDDDRSVVLGREDADCHCLIVVVYTHRSIIYNSFRCNSRRNRASIYASKQRAVWIWRR